MIGHLIDRIKQDKQDKITSEVFNTRGFGGLIHTIVNIGYVSIKLDKEDKLFNYESNIFRVNGRNSTIHLYEPNGFSAIIVSCYIHIFVHSKLIYSYTPFTDQQS